MPILTIDREISMPGGAGNVVRNLTALGAAVAFISVVGDDQAGSDLTGLIGGQPNVEPWLLVQGGRITTLKTRYLSAGQQLLRADREETSPVQPRLAERMVRIARDAMAATSLTVLSDYQKGSADRRSADAAHCRGQGGRPAGHRRSEGAGLLALCRRRHHHAEPGRSCRSHRHAGGQRGRDRCRRDGAPPAARLRRGGGDPRQ